MGKNGPVNDPRAYVKAKMDAFLESLHADELPEITLTRVGIFNIDNGFLSASGKTDFEALANYRKQIKNLREFVDTAEFSLVENDEGMFIARAGSIIAKRKRNWHALDILAEKIWKNTRTLDKENRKIEPRPLRVKNPREYIRSKLFTSSHNRKPYVRREYFDETGVQCYATRSPLYTIGKTKEEALAALEVHTQNLKDFIDTAEFSISEDLPRATFTARFGEIKGKGKDEKTAILQIMRRLVTKAGTLHLMNRKIE